MLKISEEQLEEGLKIAEEAVCSKGPECLWGERKYFPRKDCCSIIAFRKSFEYDSPSLFGKAFELSSYRKVLCNSILLERGRLENIEVIIKVEADIHDLHIFTQGFVLVFYPLFLANNREIPFIPSGEIIKKEKELAQLPFAKIARITGKKIARINRHWLQWLSIGYLASLAHPEKYTRAMALLVELFLTEFEKNQAPDILGASSQKKEAFFQELKRQIF